MSGLTIPYEINLWDGQIIRCFDIPSRFSNFFANSLVHARPHLQLRLNFFERGEFRLHYHSIVKLSNSKLF